MHSEPLLGFLLICLFAVNLFHRRRSCFIQNVTEFTEKNTSSKTFTFFIIFFFCCIRQQRILHTLCVFSLLWSVHLFYVFMVFLTRSFFPTMSIFRSSGAYPARIFPMHIFSVGKKNFYAFSSVNNFSVMLFLFCCFFFILVHFHAHSILCHSDTTSFFICTHRRHKCV